jgi:hypothetical protein
MVKIRIGPTIADEYMTRGVYDFSRAYSSLASKLIEVIGL